MAGVQESIKEGEKERNPSKTYFLVFQEAGFFRQFNREKKLFIDSPIKCLLRLVSKVTHLLNDFFLNFHSLN